MIWNHSQTKTPTPIASSIFNIISIFLAITPQTYKLFQYEGVKKNKSPTEAGDS